MTTQTVREIMMDYAKRNTEWLGITSDNRLEFMGKSSKSINDERP